MDESNGLGSTGAASDVDELAAAGAGAGAVDVVVVVVINWFLACGH